MWLLEFKNIVNSQKAIKFNKKTYKITKIKGLKKNSWQGEEKYDNIVKLQGTKEAVKDLEN